MSAFDRKDIIPLAAAFPAKDRPRPGEINQRMAEALRAKEAKEMIVDGLVDEAQREKTVSLLRALLYENDRRR